MKKPSNALAAAIVMSTLSTTAIAQSSELFLEEVIVTANKREQNLQDVSLAVTALPSSVLKDALLARSTELVNLVPSLNLQGSGNGRSSSFNIRGIGTQSFSSAVEPSVSTVLDGVVLGRSGMAFTQLVDIQRVEVLRGPQGTLFGKNASGGVVHFITKDPSEELEAEIQLFATEDEEYRSSFTVSNSLSDELAFRLTGYFNQDNGWVDNVFDGSSLNDTDDWGLRGKLLWQISDNLSLKWTVDGNDRESSCCVSPFRSWEVFPANPPNNAARIEDLLGQLAPASPSESNILVNLNGDENGNLTSDTSSFGNALELVWDVGSHTVTSISSLREWEVTERGDVDQLPSSLLGFNQGGGSEQEQFTQEIRITSPGDQRITYVAGLYYFDQKINRRFDRSFDLTGNDRTQAEAIILVNTLNYAGFGEATFHLNDSMRILAGTRYTYDDVDFEFERVGATLGANAEPFFTRQTDNSDVSGKLVAEWNVSDSAMLYASYVQGYKGPAFTLSFGSRPDTSAPVEPETSDAFELGLKSQWFDNRLTLNVALFKSEYDDFQAQASQFIPDLDANGNPVDANNDGRDDGVFSFVLANVGKVETQGIEIDFMARPTENLTLFGGFAFIDAEIKSFANASCNFGQSFRDVGYLGQTSCGDNPATQDLSGGELPFSPDWKFNVSANYRIPSASLSFDTVLKANFRAQDEILFDISQDDFQRQDSYEVLNVSVTLEDKNDNYEVTLFAHNVLDEFYVTGIGAFADVFTPNGYGHTVPRYHERTFGVEFRYRWK